MISMKKYIFFDLDGTLTDPKEGITKCVQYALASFGINEPDLDKLVNFIGPPLDVSFSKYYGMNCSDAAKAVAKYRERFNDIGIFENRVYDGAVDMLKMLKSRGRYLAIATSKPENYAVRIADRYGLSAWLDDISGGSLTGRCDKEYVITKALKNAGIDDGDKKSVIMVGDRSHDIEGASRCGIEAVGVYFGYAEEGELEKAGADYIVYSMDELNNLLAGI